MSQLSLLSNIIFPALQVMITLKGESDSSAADIFVKVGMINFRVGRLERAMPLLNKAVDIYREGGKEYESNLVSPLFVIGNIHKLLEQPKRARGVWSEAYELSTKYNGFKSDPLLNKVHLVLQQLIENRDEEETMNEESKKTPPANTDTAPKSELVETSSDEAVQNKEKSKKKPPADTDIIETSSVEIETSSDKAAKKEEKSKKKSASTKSEKVDERNGNGDEVEKKKEKSKKKLPVDTDIVETSSDEKEKKKVKSKNIRRRNRLQIHRGQ